MSKSVCQIRGISVGRYCGPVNPESKTRLRWSFVAGPSDNSREVTLSYEQTKELAFALLDSMIEKEYLVDLKDTTAILVTSKGKIIGYLNGGILTV